MSIALADQDADKIRRIIAADIAAKVSVGKPYQNAMPPSDRQNAGIDPDKALRWMLVELLADHTPLFKQFSDAAAFRKGLGDTIFSVTHTAPNP
jgi:type I restriction enzyme R subunit